MTLRPLSLMAALLLASCARTSREVPVLTDAEPLPALNTDYGVWSFAILSYLDDYLHVATDVLIDTVRVLSRSVAQGDSLDPKAVPPGFGEAVADLRARAQHRERLAPGFALPWPVRLVAAESLFLGANPSPVVLLTLPGYNADSTRAVVTVTDVGHGCRGAQTYFLARKPGRAWLVWARVVWVC